MYTREYNQNTHLNFVQGESIMLDNKTGGHL